MRPQIANVIQSMLDVLTFSGLFGSVRIPGQSDVFMGSETTEEVRASRFYRDLVELKASKDASDAELAEYYTKLNRTETYEHADDACATR